MITEEQKYYAEILKIAGFALMTPLGKAILSIPEFEPTISFFIFAVIALGLFGFGIILVFKGVDHTIERKTWR